MWRSRQRAAILAAGLGGLWGLAACAGASQPPDPGDPAAAAAAAAPIGARPIALPGLEGVEARFAPRLEALRAAVLGHDDATARLLIQRLDALRPSGRTAALVRDFERVLEGRAELASLDLALLAAPLAERAGCVSVVLSAARRERADGFAVGPAAGDLVLDLPPPLLVIDAVGLSPTGQERRDSRVKPLEGWGELVLAPGQTLSLALGEVEVDTAGALAVRAVLRLKLLPGAIARLDADGRREDLPAGDPRCAAAEVVLLAPYLPREPADAGELARYAARETISVPALLERAVRVAPGDWSAALDAVAASVDAYSDARVADLVPALRFIGRVGDASADPVAWRAWLVGSRAAPLDTPDARAGSGAGGRPELDLPDRMPPFPR